MDEKDILFAVGILNLDHVIDTVERLFLEKVADSLFRMYDEDPPIGDECGLEFAQEGADPPFKCEAFFGGGVAFVHFDLPCLRIVYRANLSLLNRMSKRVLQGLAALILVCLLIFIAVKIFTRADGFEDVKTGAEFPRNFNGDLADLCPNNQAAVVQYTNKSGSFKDTVGVKDTVAAWACYPSGTTDIDDALKITSKYTIVAAPRGSTVRLFSGTGAKGSVVGTVNDKIALPKVEKNPTTIPDSYRNKAFSNRQIADDFRGIAFSSIQLFMSGDSVPLSDSNTEDTTSSNRNLRDPTCPKGQYSPTSGMECSGPADMDYNYKPDRSAIDYQLGGGSNSYNTGDVILKENKLRIDTNSRNDSSRGDSLRRDRPWKREDTTASCPTLSPAAAAAAAAADADAAATIEKAKMAADAASKMIANNMENDDTGYPSKKSMRNTRYGCNLYNDDGEGPNSVDNISGTGPDCACQDSMPARADSYSRSGKRSGYYFNPDTDN